MSKRKRISRPDIHQEDVVELRASGLSYKEICAQLGCSPVVVWYRLKQAFFPLDSRRSPRSLAEMISIGEVIQKHRADGKTLKEIRDLLGLALTSQVSRYHQHWLEHCVRQSLGCTSNELPSWGR